MSAPCDINRALRVYLGDEHGGYQPIGDKEERLRRAFPNDYDSVRKMLCPYLDADVVVDWSSTSLAAAADLFAQDIRSKHPELDCISAKGLASRFTYSWR